MFLVRIVHPLLHLVSCKVISENIKTFVAFRLEHKLINQHMLFSEIKTALRPTRITTEKLFWVRLSLFYQLSFVPDEHTELLQKKFLLVLHICLAILLLQMLLKRLFVHVVEHFFVAHGSVKINVALVQVLSSLPNFTNKQVWR